MISPLLRSTAVGVLCLVLSHCGPASYTLDIDVSGLTDDVVRLSVSAKFGGLAAVSQVSQSLEHFSLRLTSPDLSLSPGPLELDVSAIGTDGCQRSAATLHAMVPTEEPLVVALLPDRGCKVVIANLSDGGGSVTSTDGALSCTVGSALGEPPIPVACTFRGALASAACVDDGSGGCALYLPLETSLSLMATPDSQSYFGGWAGDCGNEGCFIQATSRAIYATTNFVQRWRCTKDRICWDHPLPGLTRVSDYGADGIQPIFARAINDAWIVGQKGSILHWNGFAWIPQKSGTTVNLHAVWAGASNDIWVVGENGVALHSTGRGFQPTPTGTVTYFTGIAGGPSGVWAIGGLVGRGTILRWDGSAWNQVASPATEALYAISQSVDGEIFIYGEDAKTRKPYIYYWTGQDFTAIPVAAARLRGLWAAGGGEAVAVGGSTILRIRKGVVTGESHPIVSGGNDGLNSVWGSRSDDVWAASTAGYILHWDGVAWKASESEAATPTQGFHRFLGVNGSASHDVWVVDDQGQTRRWNGSFWTPVGQIATTEKLIGAVLSPTTATVLSEKGTLLANDDRNWHLADSTASGSLRAMCEFQNKVTPVALRLVGDTLWYSDSEILPYSLKTATNPTTSSMNALLCFSLVSWDPSIIAAGSSGTLLTSSDGRGWRAMPAPGLSTIDFKGISGLSLDDFWLVGKSSTGQGVIYHYYLDQITRKYIYEPITLSGVMLPPLNAVWTNSPSDIWIGGENGVLIHYDGTNLSQIPLGTSPLESITALWGTGPADMWLVGDKGGIWHYTGPKTVTPLLPLDSGFTDGLYGISGMKKANGQDDIVFVGDYGSVLRYRASIP